jgi:flagellar hook assembly protein FlgD
MRSFRAAAVAVATATIAAPLATVTTASMAHADGWRPILAVSTQRLWFSPNKDRVSDKAKIGFVLREEAKVTVRVRRANEARTLVYEQDLGKISGSSGGWTPHAWKWNGRNLDGKVVRDGGYTASFLAKAVVDDKLQVRSAKLYVDTGYDMPKAPGTSLDTLYPRTTLMRDALAVTLSGKGMLATVGRAVMKVTDDDGSVVRRIDGNASWRRSLVLPFDGRDAAGEPLPGGRYTLGFKVWDKAGNQGRSKTARMQISDKALVEATGSLVVPPVGSTTATGEAGSPATVASHGSDDRPSTTGGDDPQPRPCGTVVPSEVYPDAGAKSFRSADTCGTDWLRPNMAWASGMLSLDDLTADVAPRGLWTSKVSMRGRPTVAGEADTADLFLGGIGFSPNPTQLPRGSTSPATTEESVTTVGPVDSYRPPVYSAWTSAPQVYWTIATYGRDSFDVAGVTVGYSYLTPES